MLNNRISIFVPSTVNGNQPAPGKLIAKWVKAAKTKFAELFGGFTSFKATGGWVSPVHGLIEDWVTVVVSHTDDAGLDKLGEVEEFAAELAEALSQEAVSIEVNNSLQFIGPLVNA